MPAGHPVAAAAPGPRPVEQAAHVEPPAGPQVGTNADGVRLAGQILKSATSARWPMYVRNVKQLLRAYRGDGHTGGNGDGATGGPGGLSSPARLGSTNGSTASAG